MAMINSSILLPGFVTNGSTAGYCFCASDQETGETILSELTVIFANLFTENAAKKSRYLLIW